jgi:hypothetical protein
VTPYLNWIEATGISIWVRESGSIWSYPMLITIHAYGMAMLVGLTAVIDLRVLGFGRRVPVQPLHGLLPFIRVGFVLSLVSGIALTLGDAATMLIAPLFYIKMALIGLAIAVGLLLERRVFRQRKPSSHPQPPNAKALAACSLALWLAAITAGRLTAYIGPAVALKGITH